MIAIDTRILIINVEHHVKAIIISLACKDLPEKPRDPIFSLYATMEKILKKHTFAEILTSPPKNCIQLVKASFQLKIKSALNQNSGLKVLRQ